MRRFLLLVALALAAILPAAQFGAAAPLRGSRNTARDVPTANDTCSGSELADGADAVQGAVSGSATQVPVAVPKRWGTHPAAVPIAAGPHPDFNGDGYADVATSQPCFDLPDGTTDAGEVKVLYGGPAGVTTAASQSFTLDTQYMGGGGARNSDDFGHVMAAGDFNSDGYDDLVVQSRKTITVNGQTIQQTGAINVIYGGPNGLHLRGHPTSQFVTLTTLAIPGQTSAAGDLFGRALGVGDFNGDGYPDLALGIPQRSPTDQLRQAGAVAIMYGSPTGLRIQGAQYFTQDTAGLAGQGASGGAEFGRSFAPTDFNGDGYTDLAIGPRQETITDPGGQQVKAAGAMNVIYGGPTGLQVDAGPGSQFFTEDSPGLPGGGAQPNDWFGRPLRGSDFNNDGYGDVAIGIFRKDIQRGTQLVTNAGALMVIYGGPNGLAADAGPGAQFYTQDSTGMAGGPSAGYTYWCRFESVGDYNHDGYGDLTCGAPSDSSGTTHAAGSATVIYGGPQGLQPTGSQWFTEDTAGMAGGPSNTKDWMDHGNAVTGDFNGDGIDDLAVGILYRDVDGLTDAGAFDVIYGSTHGLDTFAGPGAQYFTADTAGLAGYTAQAFAVFGGTAAQAANGGSG